MCKSRNITFDIIKCLAIFFVVQSHIHSNYEVQKFISAICVAIFLIVAGYFFKDDYCTSFKNLLLFLKKKFFRIVVPYYTVNIIYLLLHNTFIKINFYTTNPSFFVNNPYVDINFRFIEPYTMQMFLGKLNAILLLTDKEKLADPSWFLGTLFYVLIIWGILNFSLNKIPALNKYNEFLKLIFVLIFSYAGNFCAQNHIYLHTFDIVFSAFPLFYSGYLLNKFKFDISGINFTLIILSLGLYYYITVCYLNEPMYLALNKYPDPFLPIICGLTGFVFLSGIANIIMNTSVAPIISSIGRHTLVILLLHPLFFKLVTYIQIICYKDDIVKLASDFVFRNTGIWHLFYLFAGVLLSWLVALILEKIKNKYLNSSV